MSKDHWHTLPCSVGARAEGGAVWVVGGVKSSELTSAPARPALSLVDHRTMSALIGQQRWSVAAGWWREGRPSPCSLCLSYKAHEQLQHLHKIFERTAACTYEKQSSNSLRIALITVPSLILTLALLVIIMWSIFNTVFIFLVRSLPQFSRVFASFERDIHFQASCCLLLASASKLERRETPPGPKCSACSDRTAFKEMTKNTIKAEILRKLGFSSAPNVTGKNFSNLPVVQQQIEEVRKMFLFKILFG